MAIIEDVLNVLASTVNSALYPDGSGTPNISGTPTLIYPGWPTPERLDVDIKSGKAHVSMFPRPEERNTSRRPSGWTERDDGTGIKVLRNQESLVQMTVWAPSPDSRAAIQRVIDTTLAETYRILMPDSSWALLNYRNTYTDDSDQKAGIFSKHMFFNVEFATTKTELFTAITSNMVDTEVVSAVLTGGAFTVYDDGSAIIAG